MDTELKALLERIAVALEGHLSEWKTANFQHRQHHREMMGSMDETAKEIDDLLKKHDPGDEWKDGLGE